MFMKTHYFLLVTLWLVWSPTFAQSPPFFHFPPTHYDTIREQTILAQLKALEIKLPEQAQLKIVRGIIADKRLKSPVHYTPATFGKPNQDKYMKERLYWVLDFNQDQVADLVLVLNTYFGPTPGYYFYFNHQGKFKYVYDNSGQFEMIRRNAKRTILQYAIPIIDTPEAQIIQTFVYYHHNQTYEASPKTYYASQTILPKKLMVKPKLVRLRKAISVRYSPKVDDTPAKKLKKGEYHEYKATQTLWGNVVARYDKGAKAYMLAQRKGWAFVAFLPNSKLIKTSLRHGMDEGYDEKTNKITPPDIKPYICGWVSVEAF